MLFAVFPLVFEEARGWSPVSASLPFLAELVGVFIAGAINIWYGLKVFAPAVRRGRVTPEKRLPPMILGGLIFPIGFFAFAWTTHIHWIVQMIATVLIGCAFLLIFQTGVNYTIDCCEILSLPCPL
jgi:DHA1 family multidrug resistance protein-like MFS transporter